jgi:hypothetical protein
MTAPKSFLTGYGCCEMPHLPKNWKNYIPTPLFRAEIRFGIFASITLQSFKNKLFKIVILRVFAFFLHKIFYPSLW